MVQDPLHCLDIFYPVLDLVKPSSTTLLVRKLLTTRFDLNTEAAAFYYMHVYYMTSHVLIGNHRYFKTHEMVMNIFSWEYWRINGPFIAYEKDSDQFS